MENMGKRIKPGELAVSLAIPLAAGGLSALITKGAMKDFEGLRQPPLSPPGWLFPVVWTGLYVLMGIASYRVYTSPASQQRRDRALRLYGIQLGMNFAWTIIFFSLGLYLTAFIWLLVMWLLILITSLLFFYIDRKAGKLMVPYILWTTFAAYLNLGVYLLN